MFHDVTWARQSKQVSSALALRNVANKNIGVLYKSRESKFIISIWVLDAKWHVTIKKLMVYSWLFVFI